MSGNFGLYRRALTLLLWAAACCIAHAGAGPDIGSVIERLDLPESRARVSEHPGWRPPGRIVVQLPPHIAALPDIEARFRRAAGAAEVVFADSGWGRAPPAELVAGADAIIGTCRPRTLEAAGQLHWLHSFTVGVDRCQGLPGEVVDRLVVTNNQRLSGPNIAEHVMAMMLSLGRGLHLARDAQNRQDWDRDIRQRAPIREFSDRTLLVAGLGGIGTEVARRGHGLGMRVVATRASSREGPDFVDHVGLAHELRELAAEADVVVNALPLTADTRGLFDAGFFEALKPGAFFISVGRGASTDTDALMAALASGRLAGAGLDVTDPEPLPPDHPLWTRDNVIITPHIAGMSPQMGERSAAVAIENLRRYIAGERLLNPVDLERGY